MQHILDKKQINRLVYSLLAAATVGGTEHNLVKQHEDDNNGYAAWKYLCEFYDEYAVSNKEYYSLVSKL